jgi:hypothetical protein
MKELHRLKRIKETSASPTAQKLISYAKEPTESLQPNGCYNEEEFSPKLSTRRLEPLQHMT